MLEGNFWPSINAAANPDNSTGGANWYDVPLKIMLPKRGTGANLLVPVCLSASAVAYSSTRIENMFMSVGSAAGVAAKQLVDGDVQTVRQLRYAVLQVMFAKAKQCAYNLWQVQDIHAAKVQDILVKTFGQRVHGPPGHAGGGGGGKYSGKKSYTVVGAGSSEWNGEYKLASGGVLHQLSNSSRALYEIGGHWRLAVEGAELMYVASKRTGTSGPPLTGWTLCEPTPGKAPCGGVAPAPHLVAGPHSVPTSAGGSKI